MVRQLSDPDGMGATPTHQSDVQEINADIWGFKEGGSEEIVLPVPFRDPERITVCPQEGLLNMEGRAVHKSCHQEKRKDGSTGSTAPVSTLTMCSLWSRTTSYMSKGELYPAEHLFIRTQQDTDNDTPYTVTMLGFPLYKGSYRMG